MHNILYTRVCVCRGGEDVVLGKGGQVCVCVASDACVRVVNSPSVRHVKEMCVESEEKKTLAS